MVKVKSCGQEWEVIYTECSSLSRPHPESSRGIVQALHVKSGYKYGGHFEDYPRSTNQIRMLGLTSFIVPLITTLVLIPARICYLLTGDFIRSGKAIGRENWERATLKTKSILNKYSFIRKEICKQLILNILKIVTYPLAMIALMFAGGIMMASPLFGMHAWAFIENFMSRDASGVTKTQTKRLVDFILADIQPMHEYCRRNLCSASWKNLGSSQHTEREVQRKLIADYQTYKEFYDSLKIPNRASRTHIEIDKVISLGLTLCRYHGCKYQIPIMENIETSIEKIRIHLIEIRKNTMKALTKPGVEENIEANISNKIIEQQFFDKIVNELKTMYQAFRETREFAENRRLAGENSADLNFFIEELDSMLLAWSEILPHH